MGEHDDRIATDAETTARRTAVRERYGEVARERDSADGCCSTDADRVERLGYDGEDVAIAPEAAELSLGCGNPTAIDDLSAGEEVIDLGSGGGFDCFLAAREVGPEGRVVGVDMTPEMLETARENAADGGFDNVEFRLGEIENLPAADGSFDVVVSNCVINLSSAKGRVFEEAYRVLRPGGRLAVSDVVRIADLPAEVADDVDSLAACIAGAEPVDRIERLLEESGFADVEVASDGSSEEFVSEWESGYDPSEYVLSASITAVKPEDGR